MNGGAVSVNMTTGAASGSGLAKELYDALVSSYGSSTPGGKKQLADLCNAIGPTVVAHIVANAQVTSKIGPTDTGLQTSTTSGAPTGPPAALTTLSQKGTIA